jgi:hypothetical protein
LPDVAGSVEIVTTFKIDGEAVNRKKTSLPDDVEIALPPEEVILTSSNGTVADSGTEEQPVKKKKARKAAEKSTETLFRNAVRSNLDLTSIADNKANIMISVNGFILTVVVTAGGFVIKNDPDLIYAFAMILITAIASIGSAVMAVKPKINQTGDTLEDLRNDKSSIIYFKHYVNMNPDDYVTEIKRVLKDVDRVHTHIARHIYGLGYGLSVKFRWLRISYTIFTIGLSLSTLVFLFTASGIQSAL